jgi:hypothetical protein
MLALEMRFDDNDNQKTLRTGGGIDFETFKKLSKKPCRVKNLRCFAVLSCLFLGSLCCGFRNSY